MFPIHPLPHELCNTASMMTIGRGIIGLLVLLGPDNIFLRILGVIISVPLAGEEKLNNEANDNDLLPCGILFS